MGSAEQPNPLQKFWESYKDFQDKHIRKVALVTGAIAATMSIWNALDPISAEDNKCGVGVVGATNGSPWDTANKAAYDAGVTNPDVISASGMLADEADKQPYGLQPGQTYKVCFDGNNPVSVETTTHPLLEPTISTTLQN